MQVAILVPAPDYAAEWRWAFDAEAGALTDAGIAVTPVAWTQAEDLDRFDLVLPLVAWGYHERFDEWLAFLDRLERERLAVANPVALLRWNSDKGYLAELGEQGVATVPTLVAETLDETALEEACGRFACSDLVVKPPVSASAYGTYRLRSGDAVPDQVRGWRMMVQPWVEAILDAGEYSLIYFDGGFSHAVSKVPKPGEFRVQPEYGGIIGRCEPPPGACALADAALAAAPAMSTYARIDIVVGNGGALQIIELELIEPALFLDHAPDATAAFVRAVESAAGRPREKPLADR